jgi:hypothetical protein
VPRALLALALFPFSLATGQQLARRAVVQEARGGPVGNRLDRVVPSARSWNPPRPNCFTTEGTEETEYHGESKKFVGCAVQPSVPFSASSVPFSVSSVVKQLGREGASPCRA